MCEIKQLSNTIRLVHSVWRQPNLSRKMSLRVKRCLVDLCPDRLRNPLSRSSSHDCLRRRASVNHIRHCLWVRPARHLDANSPRSLVVNRVPRWFVDLLDASPLPRRWLVGSPWCPNPAKTRTLPQTKNYFARHREVMLLVICVQGLWLICSEF